MKTILIILLGSVLFFACQNAEQKKTGAPTEDSAYVQLSPAEFKAKLAAAENPQLIDVRTPREYEKGSIEGATLINYKDRTYATEINKLDQNRPVFIFCQSGGRSQGACNQAVTDGFTEIYELKGGYGAWWNARSTAFIHHTQHTKQESSQIFNKKIRDGSFLVLCYLNRHRVS